MAVLTNWYFWKSSKVCLIGIVIGHPKLTDGIDITTSNVETLVRQDNNLVARTKTGTIYYLELAEMCMQEDIIDNTKTMLKRFGFEEGIISEAKLLSERKKIEYLNNVNKFIENNELLICMAGTSTIKAYFKFNEKVEECNIKVHIGTFQDSVLIRLIDKVDFRYFPKFNSCEVYHWSDYLKCVKIMNIGAENVAFESRGTMLIIRQGEIQVLEKHKFANEALFSPDCVNGKSIMRQQVNLD